MKGIQRRRVAGQLANALSRRAAMKAVTVIGFLALCGMSDGVQAYVKICNGTGSAQNVAIAWGVKDAPGTSTGGHLGVTAKGWWKLAPTECKQVSSIDAGSYWLYWSDGGSDGPSFLCVQGKPFTLGQQFRRGGDRCPADQYLAGFKRINATQKNYALTIK
jgi:uncharacterized membrane protein